MNQEFDAELDDVLHQILSTMETGGGDAFTRERLEVWTSRFPNYKQEIVEFFVQEFLLDNLPERAARFEETVFSAEQSSNLLVKILAEQRVRRETPTNSVEKIQSLQAAAAKQSLNIAQLAEKAGLSRQLLISLEQRLAKPETISRKLKIRLSETLEASIESITAYFELPAAFLPGASYKSAEQPELGEQQDFAELVGKDLKLTAEQKQALLD